MNNLDFGGTLFTSGLCPKCQKPFIYVGDIPQGGFKIGNEPYCVCGTIICGECGSRYTPKSKNGERKEK